MGVRSLDRIASQLVAGGRPHDQPVAVVQRGTFADQRTVGGTLADIAALAAEAGVQAPAITVVGDVAALHDELAWFGAGPLAGRTRRRDPRARPGQPARRPPARARRERRRGARDPHRAARRHAARPRRLRPAVRHEPQRRAPAARALPRRARPARARRSRRSAPAPPTRCARAASSPTSCRARAVAESLVEALAGRPVTRALIARAEQARDVLPDALRERGAEVEILALYRTVAEPLDDDARAAALGADYVTFTSASAVRFFVEAAGRGPERSADRLDRPDHERRAARARPRAATSRPPSTRPTGSSRRCSTAAGELTRPAAGARRASGASSPGAGSRRGCTCRAPGSAARRRRPGCMSGPSTARGPLARNTTWRSRVAARAT